MSTFLFPIVNQFVTIGLSPKLSINFATKYNSCLIKQQEKTETVKITFKLCMHGTWGKWIFQYQLTSFS